MQLATSGHPDMVIYLPGPVCLFIEIKVPGDVMSDDQERYHAYLRKCGFEVITEEGLAGVRLWLQQNGFVPFSSNS